MRKRIKYKMLAPVSHIGETASTGSYFQTVLTADGRVPVITGNSVRGQLRDSMAAHLLDTMGAGNLLGVKVSKDVFNILFSGGNINGAIFQSTPPSRGATICRYHVLDWLKEICGPPK